MGELNFALMIALIVSAVVGVLFFIFACLYHVKKGTIIIVEKMNEYYQTYGEGWHWIWPFIYRRVGYYSLEATKEFRLNNGRKCKVHYKLVDPKKYHYNHMSVQDYINKITLSIDKVTYDFLKDNLATIGVELINLWGVN